MIGRVLRTAGAAGVAGAVAGILVGGVGGRIAMRVSGALSDPLHVGVPTAAGNRVGDITLGGTLALVVFAGLLPGVIAGAAYAATRPWLAPLGRWSGVAFGFGLLAAIGPAVLEPFNFDFRRFGPPALNVAMFVLLFPLFGIAVAWGLRVLEPRIMGAPVRSGWTAAVAFGAVALGLTLALGTGALADLLTGGFIEGDPRALLLLYLAAVPALMQLVLSRARGLDDARRLARIPRVASYALLLAPAVLGAPGTIEAIAFLAR